MAGSKAQYIELEFVGGPKHSLEGYDILHDRRDGDGHKVILKLRATEPRQPSTPKRRRRKVTTASPAEQAQVTEALRG